MAAFSKPTINTPFHIDFDWWQSKEDNWRTLLIGYLCQEHKAFFENSDIINNTIDSIDPETGEVTRSEVLVDLLFRHCSRVDDFVPENGPLTDCIFRLFLHNGNQPLTPQEICDQISRSSAEVILRTLTGRPYRGIRPVA